jgi:hypothetical protein
MPISYKIYVNNGLGGDIDYTTPVATTSGQSYTIESLAFPSDNSFAVRAHDTVSGIEEANTDARIRLLLDSSGNDVTLQPNAVLGLFVKALAGGTCWVSWGYDGTGQGGSPVQFIVTLTPGLVASLSDPVATVAYLPGVSGYGSFLSGLASNTVYTIAVQAIGVASDLSGPPRTVAINYQVNPLSNVDSLVAIPTP